MLALGVSTLEVLVGVQTALETPVWMKIKVGLQADLQADVHAAALAQIVPNEMMISFLPVDAHLYPSVR